MSNPNLISQLHFCHYARISTNLISQLSNLTNLVDKKTCRILK